MKKEPLERALAELQSQVWVNGLMRYEQPSRTQKPLFHTQENGLHVLHLIADWSEEEASSYRTNNNLPTNPKHFDFFKGSDQRSECGIFGK